MSILPDEAQHLLKSGIISKLSYNDYIPEKILRLADVHEAVFISDPKRRAVRLWIMYDKHGDKAYVAIRGTDSLHTAIINTHAALVPFSNNCTVGSSSSSASGNGSVGDNAAVADLGDHEVYFEPPSLIRRATANWGNVHKGYRDTALHARDLIGKELDGMKHIVLTGHSMGGACAQILGAILTAEDDCSKGNRSRDSRQIETVTFGSPPIGDADFCSTYKDLVPVSRRIVHEYDIVPRLPIPFFKHTHGLRLIRHMPGEKRPCTKSPHTARELAQFIRYHQMNSYIAPLRKIK